MRSIPSFSIIAVLVTGCTSFLGIDDSYVLESDAPAPSTGGALFGGGGSTASTGGAPSATGGGGGAGVPEASVPPEGGGSQDSGAGCTPGHFTGYFEGAHTVEIVVPIPATVSIGAVFEFELSPGGAPGMLSVDGEMSGGLQAVNITGAAGISADLTGEFDCTRGVISGNLTGQTTVLGAATPITGSWKGTLEASGRFSGTWLESGLGPGGADAGVACVVGIGLQNARTGCGTWQAEQ